MTKGTLALSLDVVVPTAAGDAFHFFRNLPQASQCAPNDPSGGLGPQQPHSSQEKA